MRCVTPNAWLYPTNGKSQVTNRRFFECKNICYSIFYTFSGRIWHPYQRSKENSFKSAQNSKNDEKSIFLMFSGTMRCVTPNAWLYPTKDKSQVTNGSVLKCQNLCHSICYTFTGRIWHLYQRSEENIFKTSQKR